MAFLNKRFILYFIQPLARFRLVSPLFVLQVFLSQKQSADISAADKGTGTSHPSAPPCTPSLEMLQKFDYIPSLSDNMVMMK